MSNYADKLSALVIEEKKLLDEKKQLVEKRKAEIAELLERFDMLTESDQVLAGIFSEAKNALRENSNKVTEWIKLGEPFCKSKRNYSKKAQEASV